MAAALRERHGGIGIPVVKLLGLPQSELSTGGTFSVPRTAERLLADAVPYRICPMARATYPLLLSTCRPEESATELKLPVGGRDCLHQWRG
jgi:hypothetical protein